MKKILIADDHPVVREGLKKIFEKETSFRITGEARTGQEVLNKVRKSDFDLVLLDITMPGKNWLEVLKELRAEFPRIPVLIVSMHTEEEYILRALRAGASGYLAKESVMAELVEAVRKVSLGGKYVSPALAEKVLFQLDKDPDELPHKSLSDREYQVLCLIAQGKNSKDIAQSLFISENTVGTYRSRILEKMELRNTAELIRYALKHRLVD
jgi:two-component system invasion response regulator UvrY